MSDARWLYLALLLVLGACQSRANAPAGAGALTAANVPAGVAAAEAERMPHCPSVVTGATTTVIEVPDGIELRITARGDQTQEVRRRASSLASAAADTRGKHRATGELNARFGRCPVVMRNTKIETREIPGGIAIVVKPSNVSELGWVRRETEARAAQLSAPKPFGPGLLKVCPNAVPGSETTVIDKPYGADVKVTAQTAEGVLAIRERARELAARGATNDERCPAAISDATLSPTEIHGGMSIAIKAKRPEDIASVRHDVRERSRMFDPPRPAK